MSKRLKMFLISFGALLLGFLFFLVKKNVDRNLSYDFKGVVDTVGYDVKGMPTVTVRSNEYYLSAGYNFNYQIEKGDTLKKESGSNISTLVKQNGKVILFRN